MSQQLIDYYKAIEHSSQQMLSAAKQEDWEQVMRFEGVCAVLIAQLRERASVEELGGDVRREKFHIMQRILQNDAEIRMLTEPMLDAMMPQVASPNAYLH